MKLVAVLFLRLLSPIRSVSFHGENFSWKKRVCLDWLIAFSLLGTKHHVTLVIVMKFRFKLGTSNI